MATITATFVARNRITPELVRMQREIRELRRGLGGFERETRQMDHSLERAAQDAIQDMERMQREINELRADLRRLNGTDARPTVQIDDQASDQIAGIREQLVRLSTLAGGIAIGMGIGDIKGEIDDIYRQRMLYAAKGRTDEEMTTYDQRSRDLVRINPYASRGEQMALLRASSKYFGENGNDYASVASKLHITSDLDQTDALTAMAAMRAAFDVDDAERLGNVVLHMQQSAKDLRGELIDSLVEYSIQTSKFLDSPEKMAALVEEMGKMGVWSLDKSFDALKETTLKLANQGDLANVLKTGYETQGMDAKDAQEKAETEAALLRELLSSGNQADAQHAMGRLMIDLSTIRDRNAQQQVLNELGSGPGEDMGKDFRPLLEAAGRLATGEVTPTIRDRLNPAYQAATGGNPLFAYTQAQNEAKQALLDFSALIAQDVAPVLSGLARSVQWALDGFRQMPDWARWGTELVAAGTALGVGAKVLLNTLSSRRQATAAQERAAEAQERAARELEQAAKNYGRKSQGMCCCCEEGGGNRRRRRSGRRRLRRGRLGGAGQRFVGRRRMTTVSPAPPDTGGTRSGSSQGLRGRLGAGLDRIKDAGGRLWNGAKELLNFGGESGGMWNKLKTFGGGLVRKLPWIGAAIGVGQIATADNKWEAAGRVGSETIGALGGAVAGAAMGSIVPGIGTAIGGAIGGTIGAFGGGAIFDKVKAWWNGTPEKPPKPPKPPRPPEEVLKDVGGILKDAAAKTTFGGVATALAPLGEKIWAGMKKKMEENANAQAQGVKPAGVPVVSPTKPKEEKPKLASLTVQQMPITLQADGILQDVAGLLRLLRDPKVSNEVKNMVEKFLVDAIETAGGATT
ncbi:hypothetical protein LOK74_19085 [Brevibacillus humidisoli]|uniref:hypothetical protein n=1 Tax=Brevibacillus humidisoli TaxID=2895522 RepID=UPI001E40FD9E|nr:hypothetical protein [Brevibacillus humidisoli]UFJ40119.1 hypothetical protein LOK74_19085 [Brevibacillus humidisoli]